MGKLKHEVISELLENINIQLKALQLHKGSYLELVDKLDYFIKYLNQQIKKITNIAKSQE